VGIVPCNLLLKIWYKKVDMNLTMYSDGGARGNPGPAGSGAVLFDKDDSVFGEVKRYIGTATNNVAEYTAIIIGMELAIDKGCKVLDARMDSELAVKQLNREYKVKNPNLAKLVLKIRDLEGSFDSVTYQHVRRERNKHADRLVNEAIDEALG
jgi:ribonuclease HI